VKFGLLPLRRVPPDEVLYQSTVSPLKTVAVISGIIPEAQYDLSPPLTGADTIGQEQLGAVTTIEFTHPPESVTLTVIFVPDGTPDIAHTEPPVLVTTPDVLVTVPEFTTTESEYVVKSGEHVAGTVIKINGNGFT
jgi:hypothetical protein